VKGNLERMSQASVTSEYPVRIKLPKGIDTEMLRPGVSAWRQRALMSGHRWAARASSPASTKEAHLDTLTNCQADTDDEEPIR
jgi:hypothetical protein